MDGGISILLLSCLVRSLDVTFPMTTLWRALHRSRRGHSWENEGAPGSEAARGGKCSVNYLSNVTSCFSEEEGLVAPLKDSSRTHILQIILTKVEAFNICCCSAAISKTSPQICTTRFTDAALTHQQRCVLNHKFIYILNISACVWRQFQSVHRFGPGWNISIASGCISWSSEDESLWLFL